MCGRLVFMFVSPFRTFKVHPHIRTLKVRSQAGNDHEMLQSMREFIMWKVETRVPDLLRDAGNYMGDLLCAFAEMLFIGAIVVGMFVLLVWLMGIHWHCLSCA